MTKREMQRRRFKRRLKKKLQRVCACVIVFAVEFAISAGAATVVGSFILPMVYRSRGYWAFGGEWLLLLMVGAGTFWIINNHVFNWIEGQGGDNGAGH